MSETKVENVKDFLDKLTEIQKSKSDDTELFFRGHADELMRLNRLFLEKMETENVIF